MAANDEPDQEMLKNLDLLMNFEVLRNEKDWALLDQLEKKEEWAAANDEKEGKSHGP